MEIRRVQVTGGSSFVVTLPKEWINSHKIKKNDPIALSKKPDGTITISPRITDKESERIKEFFVNEKINRTQLLRQLIGAYISGYGSIIIASKNRISSEVGATVRFFTQIAIGQEVVEETDRSITIKDLLKPAEMPFDSTIKRMHLIVKSMHEDAMEALNSKNKRIVDEITLRDSDVDRLHWLVARQHNILLQNISLAEKLDVSLSMTYTYFLISRIIERMGDHVVRIAKNISKILDVKLNKEIKHKIKISSDLAFEIFNKSIGSFFRKDINSANKNIASVQKLEELCEEINKMTSGYDSSIVISIGYIAESIRRIGEYAEDISETAINYIVSIKSKS